MNYRVMLVFVDTNVVLDTLIPGRPNVVLSSQVMNLSFRGDCRICVSSLSISNIAYITRKYFSKQDLVKRFRIMLDKYRIVSMGDQCVYEALSSGSPDFEDAMQIASAELEGCDIIVTNNKKHFEGYTDIPIYTPAEVIEKLRRG